MSSVQLGSVLNLKSVLEIIFISYNNTYWTSVKFFPFYYYYFSIFGSICRVSNQP